MKYFLGIISILEFCDFLSHRNTLILQYCILCFKKLWKDSFASVDVDIIN